MHEVLQIMDDIKNYLEGHDYFITAQDLIGFMNLFCGFIIKDWISAETEYSKYIYQNEIIIQECIKHYYDC